MTQVKFTRQPLATTLNSIVDDLFAEMPVLFKNRDHSANWAGFAPVNISETADTYQIEVVAPGFEKSDFKIDLEQNLLSISVEKKNEVNDAPEANAGEKQIRREYTYRSFKRSFTLDEKIDTNAIQAKYVNGVLTLNLPKKEEVKPASKQISIQ